ncbi:MAG: alpha-ribazole phosphatase [Paraprevotella sp.]|nr:alpha-ribazole phosphatase [Paraprevotella sp.]
MEIYLARHTSVDVPKGTCYGFTDVPLKPTFKREASATRLRLNGLTFDRVYTSPLSRAAKLAAYCGHPDAERDDRLKEMDMGEWEMQRFDDITDERLQQWYNDYLNQPAAGGESFRDLYARVASFLDDLRRKDYRRVGIFAHGGVLICARIYAGLVPLEEGFKNLTPYGGVVRICLDGKE